MRLSRAWVIKLYLWALARGNEYKLSIPVTIGNISFLVLWTLEQSCYLFVVWE